MTNIEAPYLLLVGDNEDRVAAKTAIGITYWRPDAVAGQLRFSANADDLGVPDLNLKKAAAKGVRTLIVGIAPPGGRLPDSWIATVTEALELGLDVASGLHTRLTDIPAVRDAMKATGRNVFDVRFPSGDINVGKGHPRSGKRLLAVGTDCAVGKMYTTLAIEKEMRARGMKATFRATGQTGILISGEGISVDAVISDFVSGAAEQLSPANDPDHWDVIEGQGSLFHPSYAAVSLGLLHGSQPDALVLCHEVGRTGINRVPGYDIPSLADCMELNLTVGRLTNRAIQFVGVALNTSSLTDENAELALRKAAAETGLPCIDPVRTGVGPIVDQLSKV